MVRLLRLELNHVRNVRHGELDFQTLPSGGSVTGIYGQNGSGKTTVINVISLLRSLMSGSPLPADAGELIEIGQPAMTVEAVLRINDSTILSYDVAISNVHGVPLVEQENVRMGTTPDKLGRPILAWDRECGKDPNLKPLYLWNSITSRRELRDPVVRADGEARSQGRSFVFHPEITAALSEALQGLDRPLNRKARQTLEQLPMNLFEALRAITGYARNGIAVLTTGRNSTVTQNWLPLTAARKEGGYEDLVIDLLLKSVTVTRETADRLHTLVDTFDVVLPALVPGLELRLVDKDANVILDNGDPGVCIALYSVRNGKLIPFHCESEGIQRIVSMMTFLIHAYNDPDACIAIDEIDNGVFEYLLGEIIHEFANAKGQLIFTAHNLRILETTIQPAETIVVTTTDPENRFMPFEHIKRQSNGRLRYIVNIKDQTGKGKTLYEMPSTPYMGAAFRLAGNPELRRRADEQSENESDQISEQVRDELKDLLP